VSPADLATLDLPALAAEAGRLGYVRDDALAWRGPDGRSRVWTHEAITPRWHEGLTRVLADEAAALRWLLDQPEARRLAAIVDAAEARGREAERDDVVAWLRDDGPDGPAGVWARATGGSELTIAIDVIERGEHVSPADKLGRR
jgi:hypothetical protein